MQRVSVDDARPSMVLAATVKDKGGNIVLLKGTELTEKQILILKKRDIRVLIVEGAPVRKGSDRTDEALNEIDRRFSAAGRDPVIEKIKGVIKGMIA